MDEVAVNNRLQAGLVGSSFVSEAKKVKLIQYLLLLEKWNKVYNLTAIRNPLEMVDLHLLDSLSVVDAVAQQQPKTLLDVGAGAGLPSIPLAICFPELSVYAVDKVQKKTSFMQQVKAELQLENFNVINARVENIKQEEIGGRGADIIISRAFTELGNFVALTRHLLVKGGCWFAMKGVAPLTEMEKVEGCEMDLQPLRVEGLEAERHLITIKQAHN